MGYRKPRLEVGGKLGSKTFLLSQQIRTVIAINGPYSNNNNNNNNNYNNNNNTVIIIVQCWCIGQPFKQAAKRLLSILPRLSLPGSS